MWRSGLSIFALIFIIPAQCTPGFIMSLPQELSQNTDTRVCLTFSEVQSSVNADVLLRADNGTGAIIARAIAELPYRGNFPGYVSGCIILRIPALDTVPNDLVVSLSAYTIDRSHTFSGNKTVNAILQNHMITFIETDKPVYKPGQTVQFRVVSLDRYLMPITRAIDEVWIEDPRSTRIAQWINTVTTNGIASFDLKLSDEPVLGRWEIKVKIRHILEEQSFKIQKYVLPKFEIIIQAPPVVYVDDRIIKTEICAKYTYGKDVSGVLKATLCIHNGGGMPRSRSCATVRTPIKGCKQLQVDTTAMKLMSGTYSMWNAKLNIDVTVIEDGTDIQIRKTNSESELVRERYKIDLEKFSDPYYKFGMPYFGKGVISTHNGRPVSGVALKLKLYSYASADYREERNLTSDQDGKFEFNIPAPINPDAKTIRVEASTPAPPRRNQGINDYEMFPSRQTMYLRYWRSPTQSSIEIQHVLATVPADQIYKFIINYLTSLNRVTTFHYQLVSRGLIRSQGQVIHTSTAREAHSEQFEMPIMITIDMAPVVKLIVYYVDNREIVADALEVHVEETFKNTVELQFNKAETRPGDACTLTVSAEPGSVCSVGVVDKSVHILGGNNKMDMAKIFEQIDRFNIDYKEERFLLPDHCPSTYGQFRKRRSNFYPGRISNNYDSAQAFKYVGLVYVTDLELNTSPCEDYRTVATGRSQISYNVLVPKSQRKKQKTIIKAIIRSYFPETWLWKMKTVGRLGRVEMALVAPDTITDWVGSSFCSSPTSGFGVSAPATLRVFQPFFVSFTLPYSVIRNETVSVLVSVFNYIDECLMMKLDIVESTHFQINSPKMMGLCVCGFETKTVTFKITPSTIGFTNITVKAQTTDSNVCGNSIDRPTASDAVTRKLLVEAEGVEQEYTYSSLICADGTDVTERIQMTLPVNVVAGSSRGYVSVIGDIMGPTFSGLDKLLRLPTGCGEQNMVNFVPNIYILRYLDSTGQTSVNIRDKAISFLKIGYQRELTYRHEDASYSAFGENDASGSLWLTSFVASSYVAASNYITIDQNEIQKSLAWIKSRQTSSGCFEQVGTMIHKAMKGGLEGSASSPATLSAYVLITLINAGESKMSLVVQNALSCLDSHPVEDVYSTILTTYAYSLYDINGQQAKVALQNMNRRAKTSPGIKYWQQSVETTVDDDVTRPHEHATSASVEMTAYALMTYLLQGRRQAIVNSISIVRWLTKQRNAQGGFSSTQDTVIALQALSQYAQMVYGEGVAAMARIETNDLTETLSVNDLNRLLLQIRPISIPNQVTVTGTGHGCFVFQATSRYNIQQPVDTIDPFTIGVYIEQSKKFTQKSFSICIKYNGNDNVTNMALAEIKMISGWNPVKESIIEMVKNKKPNSLDIKLYEIDKNRVVFYFEKLDSKLRCLTFTIEQTITVEFTKPGQIKVYDYYEQEKLLIREYSMETREYFARPQEEVVTDRMPYGGHRWREHWPEDFDYPWGRHTNGRRWPGNFPMDRLATPPTELQGSRHAAIVKRAVKNTDVKIDFSPVQITMKSSGQAPVLEQSIDVEGSDGLGLCRRAFDGVTCWPDTQAGSIAEVPCPNSLKMNIDSMVYKVCGADGVWNPSSDFSQCVVHAKAGCPQCPDTPPDDITDIHCSSKHVYKTFTKASTKQWPMKILSDLRPLQKEVLKVFVKLIVAKGCTCPSLTNAAVGQQFLIFTKEAQPQAISPKHTALTLTSECLVLANSKALELQIWRQSRRCIPET